MMKVLGLMGCPPLLPHAAHRSAPCLDRRQLGSSFAGRRAVARSSASPLSTRGPSTAALVGWRRPERRACMCMRVCVRQAGPATEHPGDPACQLTPAVPETPRLSAAEHGEEFSARQGAAQKKISRRPRPPRAGGDLAARDPFPSREEAAQTSDGCRRSSPSRPRPSARASARCTRARAATSTRHVWRASSSSSSSVPRSPARRT